MNKISRLRLFLIAFVSIVFGRCSSPDADNAKLPAGAGIALANRDTTVSPAEDFFRYVNGGWLSRTEIPADRGSWSAFSELSAENDKRIVAIIAKADSSREYIEGTDQRKAIDFYNVGMDSLLAEKSGMLPVRPTLQRISEIQNRTDLQNFMIQEDASDGDAFFKLSVLPDMKNSRKMAVYLSSGGIGLPERDYYLKTDIKTQEIRERYRQHIAAVFKLSGRDDAGSRKAAEKIMTIETTLASVTLSKEERRDEEKKYHKVALADLPALAPSINWKSFFLGLGIKEDSVIVTEPLFLKGADRIVNGFGLEDIKDYLRWSVLRNAAPYLNHALVTAFYEFDSKYLLGARQMKSRWKRVLETSNHYLGEAIGKMYVAEVFPPEAKKKALEMVENIRFAFADRIKHLDWMSDSTKEKALRKLSAFNVKVGFPDNWRNYNGLSVQLGNNNGSFYGNVLNARMYFVKESIRRLGHPVDKSVWDMPPQTVNASYNPQFNEIVVPAGILQPPFYDYRADVAVNYGGIGAGIGHEISHGFDDQGSRYSADGNLINWWKPQDFKKFNEKGKALADQFDKYQPLPGLFVQGQFTLGENLGDLGGLNAAFDGLHRFLRENNQDPGKIDGLTPDQRFFMSWATIWRAKYREPALLNQILTNEHAPGMYRANGAPSNMPEFYRAFGVKEGDKMYRVEKDRVHIW